ncbi:hypothetical protein CERZMDRAFT_94508 [Cercospora zeae-maydis SCOH1-5]|uniref:Uncharacterized protein n=1 Tax=Cercospora zeae-maydis SCOH1-5 TaxID=717836 RepID=A0A6A6FNP5_9PEZI|nr:hypothetical protein CERZMDRAFT_94508 [Cercospora zeae-maydis SCOH1-5]
MSLASEVAIKLPPGRIQSYNIAVQASGMLNNVARSLAYLPWGSIISNYTAFKDGAQALECQPTHEPNFASTSFRVWSRFSLNVRTKALNSPTMVNTTWSRSVWN